MGEVYRAHDTKLGRDVALKVLPDLFANDPERLTRFRREAKVLASLNHPNIASIYGLEEQDGVTALVLELVEGPTLADRIAEGSISLEEALAIARQIADALEAAHEQGIVHRDLKPANIKVREDGTVKVLDYGLAKALAGDGAQAQDSNLSQSPTLSRQATAMGVILGTAAYMAPEQAKGKAVDKRGDIWAFGVVLFEMLTGERLYAGETASETLASVIKDEPDWRRLPGNCPGHIRTLLRRCLTKDPKERLRDIGEARIAMSAAPEESVRHELTPLWQRALPWAVAAALAVFWLTSRSETPPAPSPPVQFSLPLPSGLNLYTGPFRSKLAIASDGSRIAYLAGVPAASIGDQGWSLFVRSLNQLGSRELPETLGAESPFFSPDGRFIAFAQNGRLRRIATDGGAAATVAELTSASIATSGGVRFLGGTWGSGDEIVFAESGVGLLSVPASGGIPELVLPVDSSAGEVSFSWPSFLPDGKHVLFAASVGSEEPSEIRMLSRVDGSVTKLIDNASNPRYAASGHVLFDRSELGRFEHALQAVPFDAQQRVVTGQPFVVRENVDWDRGGIMVYAVAANGTLVYSPDQGDTRSVVSVDRQGAAEPMISEPGNYSSARFSPEGRRLVLQRDGHIWVYDQALETLTRITTQGHNIYPSWTSDGARVAFASTASDEVDRDLFWAPADGSEAPELLVEKTGEQRASDWSPDGRFIVFDDVAGNTRRNHLWIAEPGSGEAPRPYGAADTLAPAVSPNGRFLTYSSRASGEFEIYVQTFPEAGERWQVSAGGGTEPRWSRDGRELFYRSEGQLVAAQVDTSDGFTVLGRELLFDATPYSRNPGNSTYDVTPDGRGFVMIKLGNEGRQLFVVLNWLAEFEELSSP